MKIELPADDAGKVVSIEVARKSLMERRYHAECPHLQIKIDTLLSEVTCRGCGAKINAVEWISIMASEWSRVKQLYERLEASKAAYEEKKTCRCEHCKKVTKVTPPTKLRSV